MCIISVMCGNSKKKKKSKLKCKLTHRYRDQRCSYQGWVKCVEGINCTVTDGK